MNLEAQTFFTGLTHVFSILMPARFEMFSAIDQAQFVGALPTRGFMPRVKVTQREKNEPTH